MCLVFFLFLPNTLLEGLENFVNFSRSHRRIVRWCHKLKKKLAVSIHHLNFSDMTQGTKDSINISQHHTVIQNLLFSSYFNINNIFHTSQNSFNQWTKISSLDISIYELKYDGKKWSRIYFEIDRAPSEIPAKLPGQFGHSGQIFLHWVAIILKGLGEF